MKICLCTHHVGPDRYVSAYPTKRVAVLGACFIVVDFLDEIQDHDDQYDILESLRTRQYDDAIEIYERLAGSGERDHYFEFEEVEVESLTMADLDAEAARAEKTFRR
jgi:hypothetical protein